MNPAPKPDPNEVLRMMADDAKAEAELDRVLGLSDEEVERELVAEGYDLDKVRADAAAMPEKIAALVAKETEEETKAKAEAAKAEAEAKAAGEAKDEASEEAVAPVVELAFYRRRKVQVIVAVVATLTVGGVVAALAMRGDIPILRPENTWPQPREKTPEQKRAAILRQEARAACELKDVGKCWQKLEEAREIDPAGEKAAGVVELRKTLDALLAAPHEDDGKLRHDPAPP